MTCAQTTPVRSVPESGWYVSPPHPVADEEWVITVRTVPLRSQRTITGTAGAPAREAAAW